jgi:phage baseplate assembly protein W
MNMANLQATANASTIVFSDVNPDVNVESHLELVYNEDSINKSIVTILSTRKKSRVFRRNFGSYLQDVLFDPMDQITVDRIKQEIVTAIREWEPRVTITTATVLPDYENQRYYVALEYTIPALGNKSAMFNFNLATAT